MTSETSETSETGGREDADGTTGAIAPDREPALLEHAPIELQGRVTSASNATFLGRLAGSAVRCVYKPVLGETPLWDFPDGTLAAREFASYLISQALGWEVIPPTVLREGPHGTGMVQLWIEQPPEPEWVVGATADAEPDGPDPDGPNPDGASESGRRGPELVDLFPVDDIPDDYLAILTAEDMHGRPVALAHADDPRLERMALLDAVLNNPDRKAGHVLRASDGAVYGIDHGICLHADPKVRTVLWGWSGRPIRPEWLRDLSVLRTALDEGTALAERMESLLTIEEVQALRDRVDALVAERRMPTPSGGHVIPWPPF